jgi:hypothetical protein
MANKLAMLLGNKGKTNATQTGPSATQQAVEKAEQTPATDSGLEVSPDSEPALPTVADTPRQNKLGGIKLASGSKPRPPVVEIPEVIESLDDLADIDFGDEPVAPKAARFFDEVEATQPLRDLAAIDSESDPQMKKSMSQFVDLMNGVYTILDDPEMLGNVIRSIMIELKSHPQYIKLVADEDVRAWISSMRANMGLQRIKKEEKKTKRASGGSRGPKVDQDLLADMEDLLSGEL